ncbi:MAG: prolipoprotein diacylglyceryl transferase [Longimicrobiales bacterium]|nr:prolipoprotein diacylglyceryl transferase [Longimicrobiales bacterium]
MHPVLFRFPESIPLIGGFTVNSFGVMLYLAFVVGGFIWQAELNRKELSGERVWDLVLLALFGGLVGAKLYWVLWNYEQLSADPMGTIFSGAGLTWYGGFVVGLAAVWVGLRKMKLPLGPSLDGMAVALPISIAIGRVGCFLAGDDYGMPTGSAVGVSFPEGFPPTRVDVLESRYGITVDPALVERFGDVVPVHPTQLYEVALSLVVFGVIFALRKHPHRAGWLFAVWAGFYGVQRFVIEIFRIKEDRIFFDIFTIAQLISVLVAGAGVYAMLRLRRQGETKTASAS